MPGGGENGGDQEHGAEVNDGGGGEGVDFALGAEVAGFGAQGDDDELEAGESGGGRADDDVEGFPGGEGAFHMGLGWEYSRSMLGVIDLKWSGWSGNWKSSSGLVRICFSI
jgi:hypothetical protein